MPIYEYACETCGHEFEALVRPSGDRPACPSCGRSELSKRMSVPSAAHTGSGRSELPICGSAPSHSGGGCGAPACGGGFCAMGN